MGSLRNTFQRAPIHLLFDQETSTADSIRCLPDLIHFNAVHNPQHVFCIQSRQSAESGKESGIVEVTFLELARATERCCAWILSNIQGTHPAELAEDGSVRKSQPIAVFLESDFTLFIYLVALLTLNVPCLLLSIRLKPEAVEQLLRTTGSNSIIVSPRTRASIQGVLNQTDASNTNIDIATVATFDTYLSDPCSSPLDPSRFCACRQIVREDDRNVLILHSSGTTGLPKPIGLTHRYLLGYAACHEFPITEDLSKRGLNLSTLPLYHGFGTLAPSLSLSIGKTVWFPPSDTIPNSSLIVSLLNTAKGNITSLMTVPAILEDITLMPDFDSYAARKLAKLDFVAVGGGGIKAAVGSKLAASGVALLNHFGATELGALAPVFQPDKDYDWRYLRIRTDLGLRLETIETKDKTSTTRSCKLVGRPFAWDRDFELHDDLEANPLKPQSEVKILGRNDDLIVLATGENVLPHPLEQRLEQHPLIKRAIVFGHGQFEIGVLIEPFLGSIDCPETFVDAIWPDVQEANRLMDSHARIASKAAILLKPANKEIPLTDKYSVQRKQVYAVFKPEITSLYSLIVQESASNLAVPFDLENLKQSLRNIAQLCLPTYNASSAWSNDSDFIALGMDSLQVTRFRRILQASLQSSEHSTSMAGDLPLDIIYSNPSIDSLTEALTKWLHGSVLSSDPAEQMVGLVSKYAYQQQDPFLASDGSVVLITGSTGNLGANLLRAISEDRQTNRIICLIRSSSSQEGSSTWEDLATRQQKALQDRGITLSENGWSKVELLPWFPGVGKLGLSQDLFQDLASRVTHIFHGAWPMDFKMKVQSLEPQVMAVRELLQLARLAHITKPFVRPRVVLASSIAVVGRFPSNTQSSLVPETLFDDPRTPLPIGYAEAKWVCEKVMASAHNYLSEVEPIIVRIGQLSGSERTGFWSSKEHFPALVKASQVIGAMPDLQGSLSWIPVDQAAQVVKDILLGTGARELVYHLENPMRQPWPDMCTTIEQNAPLPSKRRLPFPEWLDRFSSAKDSSQDLVEFFQDHFLHMSSGSLILDTQQAQKVSSTLRCTGAVDRGAVGAYLRFWRSIGFLK